MFGAKSLGNFVNDSSFKNEYVENFADSKLESETFESDDAPPMSFADCLFSSSMCQTSFMAAQLPIPSSLHQRLEYLFVLSYLKSVHF